MNRITVRAHNFRPEYTDNIAGAAITIRIRGQKAIFASVSKTSTDKNIVKEKNGQTRDTTALGGEGTEGGSSANNHDEYCFAR